VTGLENKFVANLIFVGLMIFCSFMSFSSIMNILRSILELQDNPRKYSFVTVMLTNMWDTVLCIICFILAFKDQVLVHLFSFLWCSSSCLLFYTAWCSPTSNLDFLWSFSRVTWTTTPILEWQYANSICCTMAVYLPFIPYSSSLTSTGYSSLG